MPSPGHAPDSPTAHRPRRTRRGPIVLLLSVALSLVLAEGLLRLAWVPPKALGTEGFGPHPVYRVAPLPGLTGTHATAEYRHSFQHTAQRFRGHDLVKPEPRPGAAARVLFLGDSFTYGLGSEQPDTFVGWLAAAWPDVELVNAGCNDYGTRESLAVLDHLGPAIRPDVVVLVFYLNDLTDNLREASPRFTRDAQGRVVRDPPLTAELMAAAGDPLREWPPAPARSRRKWSDFYLTELINQATRRLNPAPTKPMLEPDAAPGAIASTLDLLTLVNARCRELGARFVLTWIPHRALVQPNDAEREGVDPFSDLGDLFAAHAQSIGYVFIDPLPILKSAPAASTERLYHKADFHLTPAGNQVISEALEVPLRSIIDRSPGANR